MIKYKAKIFDIRNDFSEEPLLFWLNNYRIDLFEVNKDGSIKEVDFAHVTFKWRIKRVTNNLIKKQMRKKERGFIGEINVKIDA